MVDQRSSNERNGQDERSCSSRVSSLFLYYCTGSHSERARTLILHTVPIDRCAKRALSILVCAIATRRPTGVRRPAFLGTVRDPRQTVFRSQCAKSAAMSIRTSGNYGYHSASFDAGGVALQREHVPRGRSMGQVSSLSRCFRVRENTRHQGAVPFSNRRRRPRPPVTIDRRCWSSTTPRTAGKAS
jgi:hypothetical protein